MNVHLGKRLLHTLHLPGLLPQQTVAVAQNGPQRTDLGRGGAEGTLQRAEAHQLLKPLAS
jgi:hypothetical protein